MNNAWYWKFERKAVRWGQMSNIACFSEWLLLTCTEPSQAPWMDIWQNMKREEEFLAFPKKSMHSFRGFHNDVQKFYKVWLLFSTICSFNFDGVYCDIL